MKKIPYMTLGRLRLFFAIAIVIEWGILSALVMGYESAGYLDPFSATILRGAFTSISAIVFPSLDFLIGERREGKTITLSMAKLDRIHEEAGNDLLVNMDFRKTPILFPDQQGFATRIIHAFTTRIKVLLSESVSYDPGKPVTLFQVIATALLLTAILVLGVFFILARAYGWVPDLLSDEKLYLSLSNSLVGTIFVFKIINSRLFGIKESDY